VSREQTCFLFTASCFLLPASCFLLTGESMALFFPDYIEPQGWPHYWQNETKSAER
jgi:hypothetical protein